jgi:hypothetical protein
VKPASWDGGCEFRGEAGEVGEKSHCQVVTLRGTARIVSWGFNEVDLGRTYGRCRAGCF